MHRIILLFALWSASQSFLFAQMWNGQDSLYGNEWITDGAEYYRIDVTQDGIYRVPVSVLQSAGLANSEQGVSLRLYAYGEELPIYVSSDGVLSGGDYVEFYGEKNKAQLDRHFYKNYESDMLNPNYSTINDTVGYFLTVSDVGLGKRYAETPNDLGNAGSELSYFMHTASIETGTTAHSFFNADGVRFSHHDPGEGYGSAYSASQSFDIAAAGLNTSGPNAMLGIRLVSRLNKNSANIPDNNTHNLTVDWNSNKLIDTIFAGFHFFKLNFPLSAADLSASNKIDLKGVYNSNDKYGVGSLALTYPRNFEFGGASSFEFNIQDGAKHLLNISEFDATGGNPILYDVSNQLRIETAVNSGDVQIALPSGSNNRKLILTNTTSGIIAVTSAKKLGINKYANSTADYIIISSKQLNSTASGANYVQAYANYRGSAAGGGYDPEVVNIEDLYEAFGYGVERHPLAVRNFANYISKNWENAEMIFIIGKGRVYTDIRQSGQLTNAANTSFAVPTFGNPGSDNLMVGRPNSDIAVLPVGRLAATTAADINIYLNKVKTQEANLNGPQTIEEKLWTKRVLHLAGGGTSEGGQITGYLKQMENVLTTNTFGAEVTTFTKNSTDPVQISESEEIFNTINGGLSLLTFFGHSSPGTFDFNIDNPDNFENSGRMPVLISLGCFSGNIHSGGVGISERFVLYENKGSIGFIASTGPGYTNTLRDFGKSFYEVAGETHYGAPLGKLFQQSLLPYDLTTSLSLRSFTQQVSINGDPALRLNPHPGPDYVVDGKSVGFVPEVLNAQLDSFDLKFDVVNLGRGVRDSFEIEIIQELPNGELFNIKNIRLIPNQSTTSITTKLPVLGTQAVGLNKFYITLDSKEEIVELPSPNAETNNELVASNGSKGVTVFFTDDRAVPLFPEEYSIVSSADFELIATTTDASVAMKQYVMEIDTTKLFNSPIKQTFEQAQIGGLLKWKPTISLEEGTVYYWRISPMGGADLIWEESSFRYINGASQGWSQAHYQQYSDNRFENMIIDPDNNKFRYVDDFLDFTVKNGINDPLNPPLGFINGNKWSDFFRWELDEAITVVVFDETGNIQFNWNPGEFGSQNLTAARIASYPFPISTYQGRLDFMNFIENEISDNYTAVLYTTIKTPDLDLDIGNWAQDSVTNNGKNIFNVLENIGAQKVRELEFGMTPYILSFKKGVEVYAEVKSSSITEVANLSQSVQGFWTEGNMESVIVGPAKNWKNITFDFSEIDNVDSDSAHVNVYGLGDRQGIKTPLFQGITDGVDLSSISTDSFSYLQLEFFTKDEMDKTSPQLIDWIVYFDGFPDAAVNPALNLVFDRDTIQEGEEFKFSIGIENPSLSDMDSLLVQYQILNNGEIVESTERLAELNSKGELISSYNSDSRGLQGNNQFIFELNPNKDQEELYQFNNYYVHNFFVSGDKANPNLSVTFDGINIMNGDLVSSSPEIEVQLRDENPYLQLSDTSLFKLFLVDPSGITQRFNFSNPDIEFYPADDDENQSFIRLQPTFIEDGEYRFIVQANDVTGNASGKNDYAVNFKVINQKMISNVLNYPNPFSTSTQFVYTLTGDSAPSYFKIQIFTVSGKLVKELTQHDLGPLKVGTHRTDYAWNGTDEYGDRLGNGTYFYKLVVNKDDGSAYEKMVNSQVDSFFTEGFGKMVLIR